VNGQARSKKEEKVKKEKKKGLTRSALLEMSGYDLSDWEKAGLPRDAIRSQCSTCSKHNEKETGNAED
jgi:hypothetical protein